MAFGLIVQSIKLHLHQVELNIAAGTRFRCDFRRAAAPPSNFIGPAIEAFAQERHRVRVVTGNGYRGVGGKLYAERGIRLEAIPFGVNFCFSICVYNLPNIWPTRSVHNPTPTRLTEETFQSPSAICRSSVYSQ